MLRRQGVDRRIGHGAQPTQLQRLRPLRALLFVLLVTSLDFRICGMPSEAEDSSQLAAASSSLRTIKFLISVNSVCWFLDHSC